MSVSMHYDRHAADYDSDLCRSFYQHIAEQLVELLLASHQPPAISYQPTRGRAHSIQEPESRRIGESEIKGPTNHQTNQPTSPLSNLHSPIHPIAHSPFHDILEVGCGSGHATEILAKAIKGKITAVDISPRLLNLATAKPALQNINFRQIDLTQTALKEQYDLIFSSMALHWFPSAIRTINESVKSGGWLALSFPLREGGGTVNQAIKQLIRQQKPSLILPSARHILGALKKLPYDWIEETIDIEETLPRDILLEQLKIKGVLLGMFGDQAQLAFDKLKYLMNGNNTWQWKISLLIGKKRIENG